MNAHDNRQYQLQQYTYQLAQSAISQATTIDLPIIAIQVQTKQIVCEFVQSPLLTNQQQRACVHALRLQGIKGYWADSALLSIDRSTLPAVIAEVAPATIHHHWVPIAANRLGTTWWRLPTTQHLILAGNPQTPLSSIVEAIQGSTAEKRPTMLVMDADRRLREMNELLAQLPVQHDALGYARQAQLSQRFARTHPHSELPTTEVILIIVSPTEANWPDIAPLLETTSNVQVIIVLGDREPISALRSVCHQLPVVEIPDPRYATLPDAFRPAGVPITEAGRATAWLAHGQRVWRGIVPTYTPTIAPTGMPRNTR